MEWLRANDNTRMHSSRLQLFLGDENFSLPLCWLLRGLLYSFGVSKRHEGDSMGYGFRFGFVRQSAPPPSIFIAVNARTMVMIVRLQYQQKASTNNRVLTNINGDRSPHHSNRISECLPHAKTAWRPAFASCLPASYRPQQRPLSRPRRRCRLD